jgi:hypothetical protein
MECIHCKEEINPLRLKALPRTVTCVNCSTTGAKRGIIVTLGEKDHTCNEVVFLEDDNQYEKYLKSQQATSFDEVKDEDEDEETDNLEDKDAESSSVI